MPDNLKDKKESGRDKDDAYANKTNHGIPVDRGWAWVILIAAFFAITISNGNYRSFGILFTELQHRYGSSSSITALIASVLNATYSITSLIVTTVGFKYFSKRQLVASGALFLAAANTLSSFAENIETVIFLLGFVGGLGHGLLACPTTALLSQYFNKRRSLANGIAVTGGSVGSLMFSIIIRICLENFAYTGTMLLLGGITLHIVVFAMLMRPPIFYDRYGSVVRSEDRVQSVNPNECGLNKTGHSITTKRFAINGVSDAHKSLPSLVHMEPSSDVESPLLKQLTPLPTKRSQFIVNSRTRTLSENSRSTLVQKIEHSLAAISTSNIGKFVSTELSISVSSMANLSNSLHKENRTGDDKVPEAAIDYTERKKHCFKRIARKVASLCGDLKILRRLPFLLFLPCACLVITVSSINMFLPPFAIDSGLSKKDSDFLITIVSAVEIFGTVFWGFIADRKIIRKHKIMSLAVCCIALASFAAPFFRSYAAFIAYSVWYGLFGRVYFGLFPIVLVDFLGIDNLGPALGIVTVAQTGFNAIMQPVVGFLRDSTGSYVPGFLLMTSGNLVGGLGLLALPFMERLELRRKRIPQNSEHINEVIVN